jgi:hypothetical protein
MSEHINPYVISGSFPCFVISDTDNRRVHATKYRWQAEDWIRARVKTKRQSIATIEPDQEEQPAS